MTSPNEQLELLISRIADGEATDQDWSCFGDLAARSPEAWKTLAEAQREHQALSLAVGVALHAAHYVELPSREAADAFLRRGRGETFVWRRIRAASGWAVAALIALAWIGAQFPGLGVVSAPGTRATVIPAGYVRVDSPDDALQLYRDKGTASGRVLGEMPVLLDSRPAATGRGFEVVYVRQILERAQVNDLVRFARDEDNRPYPVRVPITGRANGAE